MTTARRYEVDNDDDDDNWPSGRCDDDLWRVMRRELLKAQLEFDFLQYRLRKTGARIHGLKEQLDEYYNYNRH